MEETDDMIIHLDYSNAVIPAYSHSSVACYNIQLQSACYVTDIWFHHTPY